MDQVKISLSKYLASIEEARTWCSYGAVSGNSPTPGIHLKDDGVLGLPLSENDVLRIKRQASQSGGIEDGYGFGCELNFGQFELRNPAWHSFVDNVTFNATKAFDIGTVRHTLRKMVLCGSSSRYTFQEKPSKDSDLIGTMVIVLSSVHEGGDFNLTFGNETRHFPTAPASDFSESFIAWYTDVQVNVDPITSGHRLQLSYDLHHTQQTKKGTWMKPSATQLSQQIDEFQGLLGQWIILSERYDGSVPLVYVLDDELGDYKHQPLCCASLKDADRHKVLFLQRQCLEKDVMVYLAKLTTSIDDSIAADGGNPNTTMGLHKISDLDGNILPAQEVSIEKRNLVSEALFKDRASNDSDYDTPDPSDPFEEIGPSSDEHMRHFKDWVVVLLPSSQRVSFLAKNTSPEDLQSWMTRLANELKDLQGVVPENSTRTADDVSEEALKRELAIVCTRAIDRMQSWRRYSIGITSYLYHHENPNFAKALEAVVRATITLGNSDLVREAMIECPTKLSPALWREVGSCLDTLTLSKYKYGLDLALRQIPTFHEKSLVLENIVLGYRDASWEASSQESFLDRWAQDNLEETLRMLETIEEGDGRMLILIAKKQGKDFLLNQIIPFARKHASNLPFATEFITGVCNEVATEVLDTESRHHALREIFSVMIPAFTLENGNFSIKRRKMARTSSTAVGHEDMDRWSLAGNRIAHLIGCCLVSNLEDEENYLLNRIASEASNADDQTLKVILMPFLQTLRQVMEKNTVSFTAQDYRNLFHYIIALFIIEYVKMEPERPVNLTCPRAGCGVGGQCQDCWDLDEFLCHPNRQSWAITTIGQRRDHVERRVLASQSPYFRCDTIRNRHAPHTLQVTKTLNEAWVIRHSAWLSRCAQAKEMMEAIGHDALKQLLGNKYNECIELRLVRHGPVAAIAQRSSPTKAHTQDFHPNDH